MLLYLMGSAFAVVAVLAAAGADKAWSENGVTSPGVLLAAFGTLLLGLVLAGVVTGDLEALLKFMTTAP